jgi:hypothetical protein
MVLPRYDHITKVAQKLKLDLPPSALESAQSSLRLLKLKNPVGSFGGKYDNELKRACAILEYVAREQCGIKLPMDKLAKACYTKPKEFGGFHETIGNFRPTASSLTSKTTAGPIRPSQSSTVASSHVASGQPGKQKIISAAPPPPPPTTTTMTTIPLKKSSISNLAIQLGAFVPNSSAVAVLAQRLFQQILTFLQTKTKPRERIHGLQDIQRHQSCYEAACFYLMATKDRHHHHSKQQQQQKKQQQYTNKMMQDDNFDKQLDLSTFLDAMKDFTEAQFQMVLTYVNELWETINLDSGNSTSNVATNALSKKELPGSSDNNNNNKSNGSASSRKRLRSDCNNNDNNNNSIASQQQNLCDNSVYTTQLIMDMVDQEHQEQEQPFVGGEGRKRTKHNPLAVKYTPAFTEWKKRVIAAACKDAETKLEQNNLDKDVPAIKLEKSFLLEYAARVVLQQHGLLSSTSL